MLREPEAQPAAKARAAQVAALLPTGHRAAHVVRCGQGHRGRRRRSRRHRADPQDEAEQRRDRHSCRRQRNHGKSGQRQDGGSQRDDVPELRRQAGVDHRASEEFPGLRQGVNRHERRDSRDADSIVRQQIAQGDGREPERQAAGQIHEGVKRRLQAPGHEPVGDRVESVRHAIIPEACKQAYVGDPKRGNCTFLI